MKTHKKMTLVREIAIEETIEATTEETIEATTEETIEATTEETTEATANQEIGIYSLNFLLKNQMTSLSWEELTQDTRTRKSYKK